MMTYYSFTWVWKILYVIGKYYMLNLGLSPQVKKCVWGHPGDVTLWSWEENLSSASMGWLIWIEGFHSAIRCNRTQWLLWRAEAFGSLGAFGDVTESDCLAVMLVMGYNSRSTRRHACWAVCRVLCWVTMLPTCSISHDSKLPLVWLTSTILVGRSWPIVTVLIDL